MNGADGSGSEPRPVFGRHDCQSFDAVLFGLPLSGLVVMRHSFIRLPAVPVARLGQDQKVLVLQLDQGALGGDFANAERLHRFTR